MLAIVNRVAVTGFARRQQIGIAAAANRPRLEAEHRANADAAGAGAAASHAHHPVDAAGLVRAAMLRGRLVDELQEGVAVPHQLPASSTRVCPACIGVWSGSHDVPDASRAGNRLSSACSVLCDVLLRRWRRRRMLMLLRGGRACREQNDRENDSEHDPGPSRSRKPARYMRWNHVERRRQPPQTGRGLDAKRSMNADVGRAGCVRSCARSDRFGCPTV